MTVHERAPVVQVQVAPSGLAVTVYAVIVAPPFEAGAVQETTLCAFAPLVAETLVGVPDTVLGVAALDALDALLVPRAFVAVTVNVCAVPFARPVTVHERAPVVQVQVPPPGLAVTVYAVMVAPPFEAGAVQETTLCASAPVVADTPVGAPGTVLGVAALDALDALPVPEAFVAVTVKV